MTKTRAEHIDSLTERCSSGGFLWGHMIDYAIEQGMPVAPAQTEPVVGETLTEATRLVDGMIVEAGTEAARYAADERLWAVTGCADPLPTSSLAMDVWRIVFVPGVEPVTEQKHETRATWNPVGWACQPCGCPIGEGHRCDPPFSQETS